jgi:predicted RNase H-like HicB family nuclease
MSEIIFEVPEGESGGGYTASARGHDIHTQGETLEEIRAMVRDAVPCQFGDSIPGPMPNNSSAFVRDEVISV